MTYPVLGLGPGGCGLRSLAWLLDQQADRRCEFEPARSDASWADGWEIVWLVKPRPGVDAVGWYFLPYAHRLLQSFDDLRVIALEARPEQMVATMVEAFGNWRNPFSESLDSLNDRSVLRLYPRLGIPDVEAATAEYVRLYGHVLAQLERFYPDRVLVAPTDLLDDQRGQLNLLQFAGVPSPRLFCDGVNLQRDGVAWP